MHDYAARAGAPVSAGKGMVGDARLFATPEIALERRPDGSTVLRSARGLGAVPRCLGVLLERWSVVEPNRVFLAERAPSGAWRQLTYHEAARAANGVGQALLDRGLGPDRPLMILAENGIDHGIMMLGAMHVGVPVVPVSTAYARLSLDYGSSGTSSVWSSRGSSMWTNLRPTLALWQGSAPRGWKS